MGATRPLIKFREVTGIVLDMHDFASARDFLLMLGTRDPFWPTLLPPGRLGHLMELLFWRALPNEAARISLSDRPVKSDVIGLLCWFAREAKRTLKMQSRCDQHEALDRLLKGRFDYRLTRIPSAETPVPVDAYFAVITVVHFITELIGSERFALASQQNQTQTEQTTLPL